MNIYKAIKSVLTILVLGMIITGCQKLDRPALGNYPQDANVPGGPLKFYAAFDGTSSNPLMNAVDSIRADFPASNPLTSITGISGHAVQGDGTKHIQYANANDFIATASSFSLSFWEKRNGSPKANSAFFCHFASSNGYWTGGSAMFGLFDWASVNTPDSAALKVDCIDVNGNDNWFQWIGSTAVKGIQDNNWHHLVFIYDATTSVMTLYVDGKANPNTQAWTGHGAINMDASKITGFDVGGCRNTPNMGWGQDWDGGLDQFRLYSKALSAAEVAALYTGKQ